MIKRYRDRGWWLVKCRRGGSKEGGREGGSESGGGKLEVKGGRKGGRKVKGRSMDGRVIAIDPPVKEIRHMS